MRTIAILTSLTLLSLPAVAGPVKNPKVEKYLQDALSICPSSSIKLETVDETGPTNFVSYRVTQTSADDTCGMTTFAMVSKKTSQILIGPVFTLGGEGSLELRIGNRLSRMMGMPVRVTIEDEKLPDGIKIVRIHSDSDEGTVSFDTYMDASGGFLVIGRRGNVDHSAGDDLEKQLGASKAAARGSKESPIHILELSDFQCPTCKHAHEFVEPLLEKYGNRVLYSRLDLPLVFHHQWALRASLGARAIQRVAPNKYWDYVDYIFTNQELINEDVIDSVVRDFCAMHEIPWNKVQPIYVDPKEKKSLLDQVGRAFGNSIFATPTFLVNGTPVHFGKGGEHLESYLGRIMRSAPSN